MKSKITKTIITENRIEIDRQKFITMCKKVGWDLPSDTDIYIYVPGGGDWSNMALDIGTENPIVVEWKEITNE